MSIGAIGREMGGASNAGPREEAPDAGIRVYAYKTEFHRFKAEVFDDLEKLTNKYPLVTLIAMVACTFLGFFTVFSFSPANFLSGALLLTIGGSLAKCIKWNEANFWNGTKSSVMEVFIAFSSRK